MQLYTSGSTGKPKGVQHTTGGYMIGAALTTKYVFDAKDDDVYWCTADCGWITGHSYVTYGKSTALYGLRSTLHTITLFFVQHFPLCATECSILHGWQYEM